MAKKINVLEISLVSNNTGGVEKLLFDLFKYFDKDKLQITFLSPAGGSYDIFKNEIEKMGGEVLDLGIARNSMKNKMRYNFKLYRYLKKNKFDIVHINSGAVLFCVQVAIISKICKVKKIIVHSHSNCKYGIIKKTIIACLKPLLEYISDEMLSCSKEAAMPLFRKKAIENGKVKIVKNGIEVEKFKFNYNSRVQYRKKLGIENEFVYGHVGRFESEKNHAFLIDVFYELLKKNNDSKLILIGEGSLLDEIKIKAKKLGLLNNIYFLGLRNDINVLLNTMDAFVFPSKSEGLGIVAIEAQASGLVTVCSDAVPAEANITNTFYTIPLSKNEKYWAEKIEEYLNYNTSDDRKNHNNEIIQAGYDIKEVAKEISSIYLS